MAQLRFARSENLYAHGFGVDISARQRNYHTTLFILSGLTKLILFVSECQSWPIVHEVEGILLRIREEKSNVMDITKRIIGKKD
jgi:hypothetical protein